MHDVVVRRAMAAAALSLVATINLGDAAACGGCFVSGSETTQVTGHRMILSLSKDQTTLYDQIEYAGDPSSFAWVLPIRAQVDVGLSSDRLFDGFDSSTAVVVNSPTVSCGGGGCGPSYTSGPGHSVGGMIEELVEVTAQQVVGPFETVQLASNDPTALASWLLRAEGWLRGLHGGSAQPRRRVVDGRRCAPRRVGETPASGFSAANAFELHD